MAVVIAVDSFKGSLLAADAAAALREGWHEVDPAAEVRLLPMADGGEGTLDAFAAAVPGARRMPVTVMGPDGTAAAASWLLLPDGTGVVELASTSGIELLGGGLRGMDASTIGFGEAIVAALDHGVERLVLGIGSSASTDGGIGVLQALGLEATDAAGRPIAAGLRGLATLAAVGSGALRPPPAGGVVVLTDVTHPLLGPTGAAAVFGPQKGLGRDDIALADAALARWAAMASPTDAFAAEPGAGAAGGTGYALRVWGAELVPGAVAVADLIGLDDAVARASVVVTGEGSFDGQSAAGKAPAHVTALAAARGVPVALVAGRIAPDASTDAFCATVSLTDLAGSAQAAISDPERWLRAAGERLAGTV